MTSDRNNGGPDKDDRILDDPVYEPWLAERRAITPRSSLADAVMSRVESWETCEKPTLLLRLVGWVESSRMARMAAYSFALLIGSLPFLFLVFVTQTAAY